ncbi:MAG: HAMP domain-containing sensor histidine kinase [Pseudomonadota bacterium]
MTREAEWASLCHDIRNLLTTIALDADVLCASSDADVKRRADRIRRAVDACISFCGKVPPNGMGGAATMEQTDILELLQDVQSLSTPALEQPARISIDCPPDLLAHVDRTALLRILINLTLNAALAVTDSNGDFVRLAARHDGATLVIDVEDDGPGLPANVRAATFGSPRMQPPTSSMPPTQGARKDNRTGGGQGVPTAIALAQALGGTLDIGPADAPGTRIRLTLANVIAP